MWSWQFANLKKEKPLRCGLDIGVGVHLKKVKVISYIAQYPILSSIRHHHNLSGKHPALCCN